VWEFEHGTFTEKKEGTLPFHNKTETAKKTFEYVQPEDGRGFDTLPR